MLAGNLIKKKKKINQNFNKFLNKKVEMIFGLKSFIEGCTLKLDILNELSTNTKHKNVDEATKNQKPVWIFY